MMSSSIHHRHWWCHHLNITDIDDVIICTSHTYISWDTRLVLKIEVTDLDIQGNFGHFDLEFLEIWLVFVRTCNRFEVESPNLHQICILGLAQLVLTFKVIRPSFQLKKLHSKLLLYTDLGRSSVLHVPNVLILHNIIWHYKKIKKIKYRMTWNEGR